MKEKLHEREVKEEKEPPRLSQQKRGCQRIYQHKLTGLRCFLGIEERARDIFFFIVNIGHALKICEYTHVIFGFLGCDIILRTRISIHDLCEPNNWGSSISNFPFCAPNFGHEDSVSSLAFSYDGQLVASGGLDGGVVQILDASSGTSKCVLDGPGAGIEVYKPLQQQEQRHKSSCLAI
ncbi:Quinoprotein alcohol dehydrogenase-like superfamily protein [Raphanus sativus]|nr:Quinoprotein alcohol dehydrogenase-like superfamily protein [Raphanus sativus]